MSTSSTSLYRAFISANASEELAKEAADDISNSINHLNITVARMDAKFNIVIVLVLADFIKSFF